MSYSVIIPVLNETSSLQSALVALQVARTQGAEIILVDGGSTDNTLMVARPLQGVLFDKLVHSEKGRAVQMNAGAAVASKPLLVFLHIDTTPDGACWQVLNKMPASDLVWGRFNVVLSGRHFLFRIIAAMMNMRSRFTGIVTGDQVLFISQTLFEKVGGFADMPIMEDVELSKRLRKTHWPVCATAVVKTSSRRWEKNGIVSTVCLMWCLRLAYFLGVSPHRLAKYYV